MTANYPLSLDPDKKNPAVLANRRVQLRPSWEPAYFFSGAIEMRTVSPDCPGKLVNIASIRLGTR